MTSRSRGAAAASSAGNAVDAGRRVDVRPSWNEQPLDADQAVARLKNDLLTIAMPRSPPHGARQRCYVSSHPAVLRELR
jgi:hypothetical protein